MPLKQGDDSHSFMLVSQSIPEVNKKLFSTELKIPCQSLSTTWLFHYPNQTVHVDHCYQTQISLSLFQNIWTTKHSLWKSSEFMGYSILFWIISHCKINFHKPVNPAAHWQSYPAESCMLNPSRVRSERCKHVAPFWHGDDTHSSMSISQFIPS